MKEFDVAIIGAGAAGMMCAIQSGLRGRATVLLDHSQRVGRKILISGGGRCNFTNLHSNPTNFVSRNPHFVKSALSVYTPHHFIELVKKHRIAFHEKKLGQLFCDGSAENIIDMLLHECEQAGAVFLLGCQVESVAKNGKFLITTNRGLISAESLVIATGGLSIPQIGATGFGYDLAKQFGLELVETAPALDGFQLKPKDLAKYAALSGVSIDSLVTCGKAAFRENILFTHQGLSGPASLQASLYWHEGMPVSIDLLPDRQISDWLLRERSQSGKIDIKNILAGALPKRFASMFCETYGLTGPAAELSDKTLKTLSDTLANWQLEPAATVGYKKAEVTRGGVDTQELSSKTMESKKVPGLFFIGEVVDVTGQLGGHNFQWAWASGYAAGTHL